MAGPANPALGSSQWPSCAFAFQDHFWPLGPGSALGGLEHTLEDAQPWGSPNMPLLALDRSFLGTDKGLGCTPADSGD